MWNYYAMNTSLLCLSEFLKINKNRLRLKYKITLFAFRRLTLARFVLAATTTKSSVNRLIIREYIKNDHLKCDLTDTPWR